jgi:DNA primase
MAALTAGMDIPGRDNKLIYTESVYTAWGEKDGATAADWVNSNLKGIEKSDEILSTFSSAIIDIDPQAAVTWESEIYDGGQRNENLSMLLEEWVAMDGSSGRQWVSRLKLSDDLKQCFGTQ